MNDLMPTAAIMPELMRQLGLAETAEGWRAVAEWPVVAGVRIARHTRAVSFRDGALTVEVEGSAWMQELGFLKPELLRNLNRHLGADGVGDIVRDIVRDVRFRPAGTRPVGAGTRLVDGSGGNPK